MNPIPPVENQEPIDPPAPPELRIVPPLAEEVTAAESPPAPAEAAPSNDPNPLLEALAQGPLVMDVPRTASEAFHFIAVRAAEKAIAEGQREGGAKNAQMWGNISETYKGLSAFCSQLPEAKARHVKWSYQVMLEAVPPSKIELGQLLLWLEKVPACADDKAAPAALLWFHLGQCSRIHGSSLPVPHKSPQGWVCEQNGLTRVLSNEESFALQQQRHFWAQQYFDRCMQTTGILLRKLSGMDVKFDPKKNPLEVACVHCKAIVRVGTEHVCATAEPPPTEAAPADPSAVLPEAAAEPTGGFTPPQAPAEPSVAVFDAPAAESVIEPAVPPPPVDQPLAIDLAVPPAGTDTEEDTDEVPDSGEQAASALAGDGEAAQAETDEEPTAFATAPREED